MQLTLDGWDTEEEHKTAGSSRPAHRRVYCLPIVGFFRLAPLAPILHYDATGVSVVMEKGKISPERRACDNESVDVTAAVFSRAADKAKLRLRRLLPVYRSAFPWMAEEVCSRRKVTPRSSPRNATKHWSTVEEKKLPACPTNRAPNPDKGTTSDVFEEPRAPW